MPNLIFKVKNYRNEDAVETLVNYIMSSVYIECYGSRGCFLIPERCISDCVREAFHAVKNVYYKEDGQLVQHIIVGFGDIDKTGYLDRLFVHADYQGKGIATAICNQLEQTVQGDITTHASITAKPFFEKRGYKIVKEQQVERQGIFLTNFCMKKNR